MLPNAASINLAAVGDIFPGDHYFSLGHGMMTRTAEHSLEHLFSDVQSVIGAADVSLCNLEGPLSERSPQPSPIQSVAFRGLPGFSHTLRRAGFSHVNVANNHALQHGIGAFEDTIHSLKEQGLDVVGLSGRKEGLISHPSIVEFRGSTVALLGYSNVPERYCPRDIRYAHFSDPKAVAAEISFLKRQFDIVAVSCHAGDEGVSYPSGALIEMYRLFVDAGASCVLGHHSHVFQPIETYRDAVIAYSLGNFVFDLFWDQNMIRSGVLNLRLDGRTGPKWTVLPVAFSRDYRVELLEAEQGERFLASLDKASMLLGTMNTGTYLSILRNSEVESQRRRTSYFLRNLWRGRTSLKFGFLMEKALRRV